MAGGGVRTVQHLAERGVRLVFEVWPSRCPRVLRSPETAPERPKYTVLSGHVFIWSHYLRIGLRLCAFDLRNAQFSTVWGLLRPEIPVEKG